MASAPRNLETHHDVERNEAARLVDGLADVVPFSEGEPAADLYAQAGVQSVLRAAMTRCRSGAHRCAGRRGDRRIERVHVEAQVDRAVAARVHVVERHVDDAPDPVLVDLVHRERLDAVVLEDALLARVDVAQADVHDVRGLEHGLDPVELRHGLAEPEQEGDGHAMDVSWTGVGMGLLIRKPGRTADAWGQHLPESVVSGVLMSAWASIQMTHALG